MIGRDDGGQIEDGVRLKLVAPAEHVGAAVEEAEVGLPDVSEKPYEAHAGGRALGEHQLHSLGLKNAVPVIAAAAHVGE